MTDPKKPLNPHEGASPAVDASGDQAWGPYPPPGGDPKDKWQQPGMGLCCEAFCKDGTACTMPAFTKEHGQWLCLIHHEMKIKEANRLRDQLFGPLPVNVDKDKNRS